MGKMPAWEMVIMNKADLIKRNTGSFAPAMVDALGEELMFKRLKIGEINSLGDLEKEHGAADFPFHAVAMMLVDDKGKQMFESADEVKESLDFVVVNDCVKAASVVNGLAAQSVETAAKN